YPLVPIANFLSFIIVLIPLPWLLQHWNTGAWTHSVWSALLCFITGVNTIIWADNAQITAVAWCDITVRIFHAGSLAIVTTNFVMARRLFLIVNMRNASSVIDKRKARLFDLFVSIGIPVLSVALSWFIQGHRFSIIEGLGCFFAYYITPLYIALYEGWLLLFAILAAFYSCLILRTLIRRRNALREVTKVNPEISLDHFRTVIALACAECLFTLPCSIYIFVMNVDHGIFPWKGLADAHWGFSAIWQIPQAELGRNEIILVQWDSWITVFNALVFFVFFGF
ncbi:fungal pheromone STE3G-protein-coupled receptor, partial [Fomitiporia mediterranea MF3/22]|uniref:fungal pheromone STE3G-protein-coupled receptor n=1 Tax=Fomitiporia mediterranea (strain MF3/22) TaxID=694068 RepID=UPI000440871F